MQRPRARRDGSAARVLALTLVLLLLAGAAPAFAAPDLPPTLHGGELVLRDASTSPAFEHQRFDQVVDGIRVLDSGVTIHVPHREPAARVVIDERAAFTGTRGAFRLSEDAAVAAAAAAIGLVHATPGAAPAVERVWALRGDDLVAGLEVWIAADAPAGHWRVVLDAETGDTLEIVNRAGFLHGHAPAPVGTVETPIASGHAPAKAATPPTPGLPQSSHDGRTLAARDGIPARVFHVNPNVALKDGAKRDNRLSIDDGSFDGAFADVVLRDVASGSFGNDRILITDAYANREIDDEFAFDRADPRFLEVMVYHYAELAFERLANGGYPNLIEERVRARAHEPYYTRNGVPSPALGPSNAWAGNGAMTFIYRAANLAGSGFASAAEDGEVVVHELAHLVHFAQARTVKGDYARAYWEGTADILAAILLEDASDGFGVPCIAEWFAGLHEGYGWAVEWEGLPCLRVLENEARFPDDVDAEDPYVTALIWSGAMWDIHKILGANESLPLLLESMRFMPADFSYFRALPHVLLLADYGLTGGEREDLIRDVFARRGVESLTLGELADLGLITLALPDEDDPVDDLRGIPSAGSAATVLALLVALAAACGRRRR